MFSKEKAEIPQKSEEIIFSDFIENIQKNVNKANKSLDCVGIKYIEKFFEKIPQQSEKKNLVTQINHLDEALSNGDFIEAKTLLNTLNTSIEKLACASDECGMAYRPIMTQFEMPTFKEGTWGYEAIEVPIFTLAPVAIPKIKELTFTSNLAYVKSEGDDIYVRIQQGSEQTPTKKNEKHPSATEVKISFSPEQNLKELNRVISQYKALLQAN